MDRRQLLQVGAAALALTASKRAVAQTAAGPVKPDFALSAYSRNLQWLRTPKDLAKGIVDIGLTRVDLTVSSANGHVDPARVAADLPAFVAGLKAGGVAVTCITTDIVDAGSANAEAILKAASAAGITHYVWGGLTYDETKPYPAQIDALKARMGALVKLNQKYKIKGLYQPSRGAGEVGSAFFDILQVMRNFDPVQVGIHYNSGNLLQATPDTMAVQLRTGGAYIGGLAVTDADVPLILPTWDQGPYKGTATQLAGAYTGGDFTGGPGTPEALGGGGRPLPYKYRPVRPGTGMLDMTLLSKTLRAINFSGPAETQATYPLSGADTGATAITAERLYVLGMIKRDRITVEHAFNGAWKTDIALPSFMLRGRTPPVPGAE